MTPNETIKNEIQQRSNEISRIRKIERRRAWSTLFGATSDRSGQREYLMPRHTH